MIIMNINKTKHRFVTWNLINEIRTPISWQLRLPFITGTNEMNIASAVILKLSSLQIAALQTQRDSTAIQLWYTAAQSVNTCGPDYWLPFNYEIRKRVIPGWSLLHLYFTTHWVSTKRTNCLKVNYSFTCIAQREDACFYSNPIGNSCMR